MSMQGEWAKGLCSLRQVTEVKLGRIMSDSGWVASEEVYSLVFSPVFAHPLFFQLSNDITMKLIQTLG